MFCNNETGIVHMLLHSAPSILVINCAENILSNIYVRMYTYMGVKCHKTLQEAIWFCKIIP